MPRPCSHPPAHHPLDVMRRGTVDQLMVSTNSQMETWHRHSHKHQHSLRKMSNSFIKSKAQFLTLKEAHTCSRTSARCGARCPRFTERAALTDGGRLLPESPFGAPAPVAPPDLVGRPMSSSRATISRRATSGMRGKRVSK